MQRKDWFKTLLLVLVLIFAAMLGPLARADAGVTIAQIQPIPQPGTPQPGTDAPATLDSLFGQTQALRRDLMETRAEIEQTRRLAQSAWDGMTLTLFGILIGIGLAFTLELTFRKSLPRGLLWGGVAFMIGALVIRFFDDHLVRIMRFLLG